MPLPAKLIISLFFIFQCSFAQEKNTVKVDSLNTLAAKIYVTNPNKAIELLKESEALADDLYYEKGKVCCYLLLSKIYNDDDEYKKASNYAGMGLAIANKLELSDYKKDFFLLISEIIYDKNERVKDTSHTEEVRDMVAAIKYKYFLKDSLDRIQEQANSLTKEIKLRDAELRVSRFAKYLWTIGFIALTILLGFLLSLLKIRKVKMENKQLLTEQKLRLSQMNPHFIFNSIQNMRSLIRAKKEDEAINYLTKFSRLTRQILESSYENYTSFADELELIDNYIILQQLLYSKPFNYTVTIDDNIATDSIFIPPMLTQPFIENAIKHGISNKQEEGLITIRFYMKGKKLIFEICDNGNGFETNKKTDHKPLAMNITRERLINYTKNNHFIINSNTIFDADKKAVGAKVAFEIPYIYEK